MAQQELTATQIYEGIDRVRRLLGELREIEERLGEEGDAAWQDDAQRASILRGLVLNDATLARSGFRSERFAELVSGLPSPTGEDAARYIVAVRDLRSRIERILNLPGSRA